MPEGPEVHRMAARLDAALGGRVVGVRAPMPRVADWEPVLDGTELARVQARGKAFLLHFAAGPVIYVHLQLYGRWMIRRSTAPPDTGRSLRLALLAEDRSAWLYSASEVKVVRTADRLSRIRYLQRLGPDALDPTVDRAAVEARLQDDAFRRRALGGLLLDQGFVAGLGNYLRSEILFVAGLRPELRPDDLRPDQRAALADAILRITRRSLETGGITAHPDLVRQLRADGLPRRALRHHVFAREGRPCFTCRTRVERVEVAGRRLYRCPVCQP